MQHFILTLSQFIVLNFLYLLSCLPIFTIGAASSALNTVTFHYSDYESGYLIKDYCSYFKKNFKISTLLFFTLLLPLVISTFNCIFWLSMQTILTTIIGIFFILISMYIFIAMLFSFSLTGLYDASYKQTLKNTLLLPLAQPLKSIFLPLIPISFICLAALTILFKLLFIFIGFVFSAYLMAFLFKSIYRTVQ